MEENGKINLDRLKAYAGDVGKIAREVEALMKSDGWQIFLALWEREKSEIKEKSEYDSLEDFNADRRCIKRFDNIVARFGEYVADASEADILLNKLITKEGQTPNKGVLILDSLEEHGREQG